MKAALAPTANFTAFHGFHGGLCTAIEYYNLPLAAVVGTSVPAAEHSTITSWTKAGIVDHDDHGRATLHRPILSAIAKRTYYAASATPILSHT